MVANLLSNNPPISINPCELTSADFILVHSYSTRPGCDVAISKCTTKQCSWACHISECHSRLLSFLGSWSLRLMWHTYQLVWVVFEWGCNIDAAGRQYVLNTKIEKKMKNVGRGFVQGLLGPGWQLSAASS